MDVIKPHTKTYFKGGLRNIRRKELDAIAKIGADKTRLALHLTPPVGWLNDPNGLCFSNGYYHVFFQYSPEDVNGGRKYWGHYRSADLIDWEYLGVAIRPDTEFDRDGVYSGSAVAEDGAISIFYTGNVKFEGDYDYINNGRGSYTIYAVCEDGVNVKDKTVALRNSDYPPDLTCHVRDPKVWKADGKYYMVLGARTKSDVGEVLVYESEDKLSWRLINRLGSENRLGYMWECPDLFEIGGLTLLSVSPQGVEADGYDFNNIYQSGYMPISGDFRGEYSLGKFKEWDRGFDFYAPQTFEDGSGRRLLIGWMGMTDCGDEYTNPTEYGWQHALTIPREITVSDGKVLQNPAREIETLRRERLSIRPGAETELKPPYEVIAKVSGKRFKAAVSKELILEYKDGVFAMRFDGDIGGGRSSRSVKLDRLDCVRIVADATALEVYLNGGEEVFTTRYYPNRDCIELFEGGADAYKLRPINVDYNGAEILKNKLYGEDEL